MNIYDKLVRIWDGRRINTEYASLISMWAFAKVGDNFEIFHFRDTRWKRKIKRTRRDFGLAARVFPDGSFTFTPVQSLVRGFAIPSDSNLLHYLSQGKFTVWNSRSIKYDTKLRFGPGHWGSPRAQELKELQKQALEARDVRYRELTAQGKEWKDIYNESMYAELSRKYYELNATYWREYEAFKRENAIPAWSIHVDKYGVMTRTGRPVLERRWTEKRADYMKRRRQWLSNIKLRAGVNSLRVLPDVASKHYRDAYLDAEQILVHGDPTAQQDIEKFVSIATYVQNGSWKMQERPQEQLATDGERTVQRKAESLRRALKAVVYS